MSAYTYPGVYIEELSSGVHTIAGVATSIAAFVGWAPQGPVTEAVMVESWPQYQAIYGGMVPGVYLGYAVYQFFLNGGSQAYIVRLVDTGAHTASGTLGGLTFYANNPGGMGQQGLCLHHQCDYIRRRHHVQSAGVDAEPKRCANTGRELYKSLDLTDEPWLRSNGHRQRFQLHLVHIADWRYAFFDQRFWCNRERLYHCGAQTSSTAFTAGETVKQTGTSASATLLGEVGSSYLVLSGAITGGTANGSGVWTGGTSGATFSPTTAPVASTSTPISLGTTGTRGADGNTLLPNTTAFNTPLTSSTGGYALLSSVAFNLLCVPGENDAAIVGGMQKFCHDRRAFLIVDSAQTAVVGTGSSGLSHTGPADSSNNLLSGGQYANNSAFYFPWVSAPDPQVGFRPTLFPPCGFVAGIYASTDASRGVWKAPAGVDSGLTGALGLQYVLTDIQKRQPQHSCRQLSASVSDLQRGSVGGAHHGWRRRRRLGVEICSDPSTGALPGVEPLCRNPVGRV